MSKTAHDVIAMAGGAPMIAKHLKLTGAAVRKWRSDGIPLRHWRTMIAMASERGELVTANDLMNAKMEKRDVAA